MIENVLKHVEAGHGLSMEETAQTLGAVMEGRWSEDQIVRLLLALREKGETIAEIAGAAAAVRRHMTPIRTARTGLLDTCGTGGDGSRTFNISTTTAMVAAAAGVPVAKHGNRSITSRSGSADVLAVLGVNIDAEVARVEDCLDALGICFCLRPSCTKRCGTSPRSGRNWRCRQFSISWVPWPIRRRRRSSCWGWEDRS